MPIDADPIPPGDKQFTPSDLSLTLPESILALIERGSLTSKLSGCASTAVSHTSTTVPGTVTWF